MSEDDESDYSSGSESEYDDDDVSNEGDPTVRPSPLKRKPWQEPYDEYPPTPPSPSANELRISVESIERDIELAQQRVFEARDAVTKARHQLVSSRAREAADRELERAESELSDLKGIHAMLLRPGGSLARGYSRGRGGAGAGRGMRSLMKKPAPPRDPRTGRFLKRK